MMFWPFAQQESNTSFITNMIIDQSSIFDTYFFFFFSVIGYRETAFAYAISAAGVAHSIAKACSMGRLISCGCDPSSYKGKLPAKARGTHWKWGGCSHNLEYGIEFSRQFLDSREKAGDIQSSVNLHNNQAGRLVILFLTILISKLNLHLFILFNMTVLETILTKKKNQHKVYEIKTRRKHGELK